jgi:hypothetical protein
MAFIGKHWLIVPHFDKAHFDQRREIVRIDGRQLHPLGFDIAQHPTKMDRRL